MRKDSKTNINPEVANIQGYHSGGYTGNYAFMGFRGNWYFNSDRKEETVLHDGTLMRRDRQGNKIPFSGYGLEIETECRGIRNRVVLAEVMEKIVFPVFKFGADMFKMQCDGSLGGDTSVEVITQVMTKSRIRNDYAAYKAMFNTYFREFKISADSYTTSCGMHVNVSNAVFGSTEDKQTEAIRKLYYIINKHYSLACKLLYRSPEKTHWCGRMDYSDARNLDLYHMSGSHGNCMNLSHYPEGRIEIRLVGGQKDYYCFRNTMESVFFLCERVRSISWADCDKVEKIFNGCNQYVLKRLETECGDYITQNQLDEIRDNVKPEDLELRH